jgi:hypothetical protein
LRRSVRAQMLCLQILSVGASRHVKAASEAK